MNYKVYHDGTFSYICKTDEDKPNGFDVFEKLSEAKKSILEEARGRLDSERELMRRIRALKDSDIEIE